MILIGCHIALRIKNINNSIKGPKSNFISDKYHWLSLLLHLNPRPGEASIASVTSAAAETTTVTSHTNQVNFSYTGDSHTHNSYNRVL